MSKPAEQYSRDARLQDVVRLPEWRFDYAVDEPAQLTGNAFGLIDAAPSAVPVPEPPELVDRFYAGLRQGLKLRHKTLPPEIDDDHGATA